MPSPLRDDSDAAPFVHPGDRMDAAGEGTGFDLAEAPVEVRREVAEIFVQLFAQCIPIGTPYKGSRKWKAGYNRMVAIAYTVAPELFNGMKQHQVAAIVGVHEVVFRRLCREVEATIEQRAASAQERRKRR